MCGRDWIVEELRERRYAGCEVVVVYWWDAVRVICSARFDVERRCAGLRLLGGDLSLHSAFDLVYNTSVSFLLAHLISSYLFNLW